MTEILAIATWQWIIIVLGAGLIVAAVVLKKRGG